ncbi:restriction endonuclease subunit S [Rudaea sp.]|uniref:restriction endonuclease subunit S n=1 Tax=Rudaea sp. TaxID=2136325 RepID=UPI00378467F5
MTQAMLRDVCVQSREQIRAGARPDLKYIGLESIEPGTGGFVEGELSKTPDDPRAVSFHFDARHVLYGKLRPYLNKVAIPEFEGKCSTELIPLLPSAQLDRRYLAYFLRSPATVQTVVGRTAGSRMPRADMNFLLDLEIPLPPLDEQRRIVDVLARAEGIVSLRREAQQKTAELIPALFLDLFGDPATNPKHWPVVPFESVIRFTRYGPRFPNREYSESLKGGRVLRTTDIKSDGTISADEAPMLPMTEVEIEKYSLQPNTIVVTRTGATIGKVALYRKSDEPAVAGAYLIEIRLSEQVTPEFVLHLLMSQYGQQKLTSGARAVAQPNLNVPTIAAIPVPVPPVELQHQFAAKAEAVRSIAAQQSVALATAQSTFATLLHRAFAD